MKWKLITSSLGVRAGRLNAKIVKCFAVSVIAQKVQNKLNALIF